MADAVKPSYPVHESALLPCPFCGNAPTIANIKPHSHKGIAEFMPDHPGSSYVECSCGAGLIDATEELVVARWNKRCGASAQPSRCCAHLWVCTGCGTRKSMEQIKGETPQAIACCPERHMAPAVSLTMLGGSDAA